MFPFVPSELKALQYQYLRASHDPRTVAELHICLAGILTESQTSKTFFSTDVVKYQDPSRPEGAFSLTALERWFQIAFPLTAFTLILSYLVQRSSSEKLSQHGERVRSMSFFRKHTQPLEKDKV